MSKISVSKISSSLFKITIHNITQFYKALNIIHIDIASTKGNVCINLISQYKIELFLKEKMQTHNKLCNGAYDVKFCQKWVIRFKQSVNSNSIRKDITPMRVGG